MPQTEEEHLENESLEDDRSTKDPNDAEVSLYYVASFEKVFTEIEVPDLIVKILYISRKTFSNVYDDTKMLS